MGRRSTLDRSFFVNGWGGVILAALFLIGGKRGGPSDVSTGASGLDFVDDSSKQAIDE
jgi:hypothetical protein